MSKRENQLVLCVQHTLHQTWRLLFCFVFLLNINDWQQMASKKDEEIKPWCLPTTLHWHKQDPLKQCFHVRNNRLFATTDSLSFTCNADVQPGSAWGVNVSGNQLKSSQHNHFLAMQPIIKICRCFCYSFLHPLSLLFLPHTPINWQKINWQPIW